MIDCKEDKTCTLESLSKIANRQIEEVNAVPMGVSNKNVFLSTARQVLFKVEKELRRRKATARVVRI